jgi:hypothetical protein
MSITALSGSRYTLQRLTPFLLEAVTAAGGGHAPTRQPPAPSSVQVKATAAGTVVVAGVVDGSSTSETLTFTAGGGYRATARRFTSVTTITPTGALVGTTFSAKFLGADGSVNPKLMANVATGVPGAFSPGTPKWVNQRDVRVESRQAMIGIDYRTDLEPKRGDYLLDEDTAERWQVEGSLLLRGGMIPHHWEVHVSLRDGEAPE